MPEVIPTAQFVDDADVVYSPRLWNEIQRAVTAIELFGDIGSHNVPESIRRQFEGIEVRKAPVGPFDLVYSLDAQHDVAYLHALIHQKVVC